MWRMFHPRNAIEAAAVTIRFGEPLSAMVTKRVIKAIDELASGELFHDRQPLQQIQVQVNQQNADVVHAASGLLFQHISVARDDFGNVGPQLHRQLVAQPDQLSMKLFRYRGWEVEWPAISKLLSPALAVAARAVPVAALRLEYLNRFIRDGLSDASNEIASVLRPSRLIAEHVFESPDLWHSHTGLFDQLTGVERRLVQVNADLQLLNPPHPNAGGKTLALMLAVERQFGQGLEIDPDSTSETLAKYFSCLHDDIHGLFKQVVDSEFAKKNELPT